MRIKSKCVVILMCTVIVTGCGSNSAVAYDSYSAGYGVETANEYSLGMYSNYDDSAYEYSEDTTFGGYSEDEGYTYKEGLEESEGNEGAVSLDMLIYRGSVSITTKDFNEDLSNLKNMLKSYNCFFENESKWTEYTYDDRDLYHYSATVRVASSEYENLINGIGEIGTTTNLSSSCENVSAEYSDTIVAIDIYEAERDRYVKLLSTITDDQYAIEVQRELTDIELKLAQYRARKQNIETDVSYSYITIDLREVREYTKQTEYNDSFLDRLLNTVVNTWYEFLSFLENVLFYVIEVLPYVIFWLIVLLIVRKLGVFRLLNKIPIIGNITRRLSRKNRKGAKDVVDNKSDIDN